jgi:hypothetical protein
LEHLIHGFKGNKSGSTPTVIGAQIGTSGEDPMLSCATEASAFFCFDFDNVIDS